MRTVWSHTHAAAIHCGHPHQLRLNWRWVQCGGFGCSTVYTWGIGAYGSLCHDEEGSLVPKQVHGLAGYQVLSISAGGHCLAVTERGDVFSPRQLRDWRGWRRKRQFRRKWKRQLRVVKAIAAGQAGG